MATVPITLFGVTFAAGSQVGIPTTFVGQAFLTGLGVGGGPAPGGPPLGIWGGGGVGNYPDAGFPGPQPGGPIGIWGGGGVGDYIDAGFPGPQRPPGHVEHPIIIPVPPDTPNVPPPGSPPQIVSGAQPAQPIVPPDAIIVEYPGVGKVVVPKPTETMPPMEGQGQAQKRR